MITHEDVKELINDILAQAGETAIVNYIRPDEAMVIDTVNGRNEWRTLPGFCGLTIHLGENLVNATKARHALDQSGINAEYAISGNVIRMRPIEGSLPYTAPRPRASRQGAR
jgi:hypothetical protein